MNIDWVGMITHSTAVHERDIDEANTNGWWRLVEEDCTTPGFSAACSHGILELIKQKYSVENKTQDIVSVMEREPDAQELNALILGE